MSIKAIHVVPNISNESSCPSYSMVNLSRSPDECGVSTTMAALKDSNGPSNSSYPVILQIGTTSNKKIERTAVILKGLRCKMAISGKMSLEMFMPRNSLNKLEGLLLARILG